MRIIGIALVTALLAGAAHGNLIVNGDFEAIPAGYANPGTPLVVGGWTFENHGGVEAVGGNPGHKARLESAGGASTGPTAAQTVSGLVIGQSYRLEWDFALRVNFAGSGNGPSFGVFLDTQTFAHALHLESYLVGTYVHRSVDFSATSTSHTFIFAGELDGRSNGAGTTDVSYNLDNVSLNPVPEPGSVAVGVFVTSAVASAWKRRRRLNE